MKFKRVKINEYYVQTRVVEEIVRWEFAFATSILFPFVIRVSYSIFRSQYLIIPIKDYINSNLQRHLGEVFKKDEPNFLQLLTPRTDRNVIWRPRICKNFEITRTIYLNSERSEYFLVKFLYSEKATKFYLSYVITVKSTVEISQHFVGFSEYLYEL